MANTPFPWPDGRQGAISLTFDDGMRSQYEVAVPTLNEHGLCGTFYLQPRDDYEERLAPWRQVLASGHELGNHSIHHYGSVNISLGPVGPKGGVEELTLADMEYEITEAARRLHSLFPEQRDMSFAYPCYQSTVGAGIARQSYVPLVARHCVAGRGLGEAPFANHPYRCDLAYLWAWPCERKTAAEMIGLAEQAVALGHWGIFIFHGVNEGHLSIADWDLAGLCAFLARQSERIWTAPVATVARWITVRRSDTQSGQRAGR